MKSRSEFDELKARFVAPLAGVWIEMLDMNEKCEINFVAPLAGVWIEM